MENHTQLNSGWGEDNSASLLCSKFYLLLPRTANYECHTADLQVWASQMMES